ncbi:Ig-like domain-containing protein [Pantoea sp. R102]|uniref:Ig-like domain-containing protein n=1 Tax=Pantoea sp. R102 TaxID=2507583 RepID=UPI0010A7DC7E|nr:Ig-like domain-containing protein [Pantoea sp. R102]THD40635.1 hypothetical protein ERD80_04085 [Pantoea sp. R102]
MDLFDFKEVKYLERDTNNPTFFGKIDSEVGKGGQVMITLGDRNFFVDINPQDGSWKWTPPEALTDGEYSLSFMTIDTAGNLSTPTQRTLIVDTTPPVAPTLLNLYDDQGSITGSFDAGKMTDDRRPTLTGIAEKGTVVYLKEGNTVIGSAKADEKTGLWTLEPTVDLADGRHNLTLVAAETFAGKVRESEKSDAFSITIGKDELPPTNPGESVEITHALDNVGSVTGSLKSGGLTDDTMPELHGTAAEGSTVRIQYRNDRGEWVDGGNAVMDGTHWVWTPNPALDAGSWEFRANAGSGWSDEFILEIDLSASAQAEITHAWDDYGLYTGMLGNGAITDDPTLNLYGRAESNSVVYIHNRNTLGTWELLGSVIADEDGRWQYDAPRLTSGKYEFQAGASATRDTNGKPFELTIAASGSIVPAIHSAWDDSGHYHGVIKSGGFTDDTTPTLSGKAEANSIVIIEFTNNNVTHTASVQADYKGNWSYTPGQLEIGTWTFSAETQGASEKSKGFVINIENREYSHSECNFNYLPENLNEFLPPKVSSYGKNFNYNYSYEFDNGFFLKAISGSSCISSINTFHNGSNNLFMNNGARIEINIPDSKTIDFDVAYGKNGYFTIYFYGPEGRLINHQNVNVPNNGPYHKQFSFEGEVISSFLIEVHDDLGLYFDNFVWNKENMSLNNLEYNFPSIYDSNSEDIHKDFSIEDILSKGQKDLFIDDGKTQLMVNGNQGDTVRLEDILPEGSEQEGWTEQAGTVTIAGSQYHVFSHGDAELLVQDGVKIELV